MLNLRTAITAIMLACAFGLAGCRPVPQVLGDEAVFNELDAMYTAVTSKRRDLLDATATRLAKLHQDGKLSDAGQAEITAIRELADQQKWDVAAQRLYDFMRAQRKPSPD